MDTEFENGLSRFYRLFFDKIIYLINKEEKNDKEETEWKAVAHLIGNPDNLKQ